MASEPTVQDRLSAYIDPETIRRDEEHRRANALRHAAMEVMPLRKPYPSYYDENPTYSVWLSAPNADLGGRTPWDAYRDGNVDAVLDALERLRSAMEARDGE